MKKKMALIQRTDTTFRFKSLQKQQPPNLQVLASKKGGQPEASLLNKMELLEIYLNFKSMCKNQVELDKEDFVKLYSQFHINHKDSKLMFEEMVIEKGKNKISFEDFLELKYGKLSQPCKQRIETDLAEIKKN